MVGSDKYIGRMLDNRYEILELIGTGGMALVYKARCHRLNRYVAIKILKEELANDEEFRRRFHTESQAVGMLSHPNIVAIYDVSRSENTEYIVMELIEGITLKQYINRKGLLNWKEALHFTTQVTKAISHAHSRGIVHRDIKPHNIMVLKDGSVKVADFGIARLLSVQNTLTQEALGSVHYISPEQAKGGHMDARSDIYSVGVVMYEMLTSRLPFVGESAVSIAIQHISAIPLMPRELNPEIPVGLEDITMHAMEPDLNLRYTTADEMLNDLEVFRKNPSTTFNYALIDLGAKHSSGVTDRQETRVINTAASTAGTERKAVPDSKTGRQQKNEPGKTAEPERITEWERKIGANKKAEVDRKTALEPGVSRERNAARKQLQNNRTVQKKPEMNVDEYRTVRKRASSTSTLVGIFLIVIFLIALVVFMWNYLLKDIFSPNEREKIQIPSFLNRIYIDVIRDTEYAELYSFKPPAYVFSNEVSEGMVVSQSPTEGIFVDTPLPGNKISIELTVSKGEEPAIKMPDLLDKHYSVAMNELDALSLDLKIIQEPVPSEITKGYVISTIPEAGELLARENRVTIIYSGGLEVAPPIEVPDLVGSTVDQVDSALRSLEITPKYSYFPDDSPEGTVLFIQYAGQLITVPRTLEVYVSDGPPETPEPEETDDTEPPEETDDIEPPEETDDTEPPTDTPIEPPPTDPPPMDVSPTDTTSELTPVDPPPLDTSPT